MSDSKFSAGTVQVIRMWKKLRLTKEIFLQKAVKRNDIELYLIQLYMTELRRYVFGYFEGIVSRPQRTSVNE